MCDGGGSPLTAPTPSGSTPPSTTVSCKCCGCVTSATIGNIQPYNDGNRFGHNFDFTIQMSFTAGAGGTSDCTLEWWEKTNIPYLDIMSADTWIELYGPYSVSPTFDPWKNRVVPCPGGGALTVTITDVPGLGIRPGRTARRTLQFRLVVKSGSGCACTDASQTATATQVLEIVNGVPAGSGTLTTS
jgi:hypothetical protein